MQLANVYVAMAALIANTASAVAIDRYDAMSLPGTSPNPLWIREKYDPNKSIWIKHCKNEENGIYGCLDPCIMDVNDKIRGKIEDPNDWDVICFWDRKKVEANFSKSCVIKKCGLAKAPKVKGRLESICSCVHKAFEKENATPGVITTGETTQKPNTTWKPNTTTKKPNTTSVPNQPLTTKAVAAVTEPSMGQIVASSVPTSISSETKTITEPVITPAPMADVFARL